MSVRVHSIEFYFTAFCVMSKLRLFKHGCHNFGMPLFYFMKSKNQEPLVGFLNKPELQYFRTVLCICDGFSDFTPNIHLAKKRKVNDPGQFAKLERKSLSEFVKKEINK